MSRPGRHTRLAAAALLFAAVAPAARGAEPAPLPSGAIATPAEGTPADARGDELLLAGDLAGAAAAYRQAIDLNLGSTATHAKLGRVELERGERLAARKVLRRALELDPEHVEAHYLLGVTYDGLGFDRLARRHYRRAFELEPALTDPLRHPEVARRRRALSVLLGLWHEKLDASADGAGTSPTPGFGAALPSALRSPERLEPPPRPLSSSGSVAPPSARTASRSASSSRPRSVSGSKPDRVIDASDLRSRSSVNQAQPSGQAGIGRPRLPSAARGTPTRYTPPPPPPDEPEVEPEPDDLESVEAEESAPEEDEPPAEEEEPPPISRR